MTTQFQIRNDFPLLSQEVNGNPLVYLDSAASSLTPQTVIDRITRYYSQEHSNVHRGIHRLSQNATDAYESTRDEVQRFINAKSRNEIVFTYGTTDSINLLAATLGSQVQSGDTILITEMEHHANIVPWQEITWKTGAELAFIPMDSNGDLDLDVMKDLLRNRRVKILALVHISNSLGTVNPVEEIIQIAHENGTLVMIDAAQSAPHMPLDVQKIDCDFLVFSAHKVCGPTGFGILYGKEELLNSLPPYRSGGSMIEKVELTESTYQSSPFRFETGTPPIASGIAFSESIAYYKTLGWEWITRTEHELFAYAENRLKSISGLKLIGSPQKRAAVLPFVLEGIHGMDAGMVLDKKGFALRTGHHCTQPVLRHFSIASSIRASFMFYNTKEEIDRFIVAIEETKAFFT